MLVGRGEDLALLLNLADLQGDEAVLDVGTAAGATALALAAKAGQVVGVDMSERLIASATEQAASQGQRNVRFQLGDAGALPFADGSFDLVVSRQAGHHFPAVPAFCREAARVLRPGGRLIVLDNVAPEADQLDEFVNGLEKLRDPDHARSHRLSEWLQFLAAAGLRMASEPLCYLTPEPLPDWMERLVVSPAVSTAITERLGRAPAPVREAFSIRADSFCLPRAAICATK